MIDVAIKAAKEAGALAYRYFKTQPKVSYKPDNSPVTKADLEAEELARKIITKNFPNHGIIGEEFAPVNPNAKYQWVIDPIDGTNDFIRNIPYWSTLLAVVENGKPIIGIAFFPGFGELFIARRDRGTFLNDKRTKVSKISDIHNALINHGAVNRFEKIKKLDGLIELARVVRARRYFGSYGWAELLRGNMDVFIEPVGGIYDFAAPSILVEEAGGKFTDIEGKISIISSNCLATNGLLHNQVLKILNS